MEFFVNHLDNAENFKTTNCNIINQNYSKINYQKKNFPPQKTIIKNHTFGNGMFHF